ncbi:MAG: metallophosphoesterase [Fimbriimonas sp.]
MTLSSLFILTGLLSGGPQEPPELLQTPFVQLGEQSDAGVKSFAITWQTNDVDAKYELTYSQGNAKKLAKTSFRTVRVEGIAAHRVYQATISGFRSGSPVRYTLTSPTANFTGEVAAPKSARQDYSFVVFGDCGIGNKEQAKIAYQTYLQKPDLIVLTGDIVYNDGRISEYRKNFYPYYATKVADPNVGAPLLSRSLFVGVPGNHDILNRDLGRYPDGLAYYHYWHQPLNGPLRKGQESTPTLTGPLARQEAFESGAADRYPRMSNFSFDYGNAHWTVLDANRYVNWNDPKLRAWLAADLKAARKKTWRFVTFHQPGFHSSDSHQGEKQMRAVASIFEEGKVDIVFSGHVHNYQRTFPIQVGDKAGAPQAELEKDNWPVDKAFDGNKVTRANGVLYIVDGGGGARLYEKDFGNQPEKWKPFQQKYVGEHCFSTIKVSGKKLTLVQINVDGKEVDRMVVTK